MKMTTLEKVRRSLETMTHQVVVDPTIAERARLSIERMIAL
jgi:quinolinate synthase